MNLDRLREQAIAKGWTDLQQVDNWIWGYPPHGAGVMPVPYPKPVAGFAADYMQALDLIGTQMIAAMRIPSRFLPECDCAESGSIRVPRWENPAFSVDREAMLEEVPQVRIFTQDVACFGDR